MKKLIALALALCMILTLVACGSQDSEKDNDVTNNTEANYDADITIVISSDMVSFDPMASSDLTNQNVLNCVYDRLFQLDENLEGTPYLVKEWSWIDDSTAQFTIYDNVSFTNGDVMDTEDVKFAIEYAVSQGFMNYIEEVEIVDATTFKIHCNGNAPALATNLSSRYAYILPKEYYEEAIASGDWSQPVGSGRYTLDSRIPGDSVKLVRNDNYWNKDDGALNKSLTFKVIPEGANRTILVETGEADLNANFATADYERVKNDPNMKLWEHESSTIFYLGFDNQNEILSNPLVRQAINYVIDRDGVVLSAYDGLGTAHYSTLPPAGLGYVENPGNYSYNVEKAQELMKEAGVDGFSCKLYCWNDTNEKIATVVQSYLSKININVEITRIESSVMNKMAAAGEVPMWVASWGCYADPDLHLASLFSRAKLGTSNRFRHDSDYFEEKYMEGRTPDTAKRIEVYQELQQYFADEAIWCPLFVNRIFACSNAKLQGVQLNTESAMNYHTLHY